MTFGTDHIDNLKVKDFRVLLSLSLWVVKVEGDAKESGTCGGYYWFILKGMGESYAEGGVWGGLVVMNEIVAREIFQV